MPFSFNTAYLALDLCQRAYLATPDLPAGVGWELLGEITVAKPLVCPAFQRCFPGQDLIGSSFGYCCRNEAMALTAVVFRGTENPIDWAKNLEFELTEDGYEAGFRAVYLSLALPKWANSDGLTVCGHSLGGALAFQFSEGLHTPHQLYTFNSPRVFSRTRAKEYDACHESSYRIENRWDLIVPHVPLELEGFDSAAVAIEVDGGPADEITSHLLPNCNTGLKRLEAKSVKKAA